MSGVTSPTDREQQRVDVLAFPSPTTARFLLVIMALLTAGLFVGTWVHNSTDAGTRWVSTAAACSQDAFGTPRVSDDPLETFRRQDRYVACTSDVERLRAAYSLGGLLLAAVVSVVVLYSVPVVTRRRRRLRPAGANLAGARQRFTELAVDGGALPVPLLEVGSAALRDPFTYGVPGRYRVVLPKAVAVNWLRPGIFDPVVRHELAHVTRHDVPMAWLSTSLWLVLAPMLVLPVVVDLASGDLSLLPDYAWRAVLVAVVALLAARATLRSRELDADLTAVARQPGAAPTMAVLLRSIRPVAPRALRPRVLAYHPTPATRAGVVEEPQRAVPVTFVDGLTSGFLAALSAPLILTVLTAVAAPMGWTEGANALTSVVLGPLLGTTVGLGLWRQAAVSRVTNLHARVAPIAAGVGAGVVLGQATSLADAGLGLGGSVPSPWWVLVSAALSAGATVMVAGLAELWADASPRLPNARAAWLPAVVVSSALFAAVLWTAETGRQALDGGSALLIWSWFSVVASWPPALVVLLLGAAAARATIAATGAPTQAPSWMLEAGSPPWTPPVPGQLRAGWQAGLLAGAVGAASIVVYRLVAGPAVDDAATTQRFFAYLLVAVGVQAAAAVALCLLVPQRGPGLAVVAAPIASLVTSGGLVVMNTALGGAVERSFVEVVVRSPLGMGLPVVVGLCLLGLLRGRGRERSRSRAAVILAPVAAVAVSAGVLAVHALGIGALADPMGPDAALSSAELEQEIEVQTYRAGFQAELADRYPEAIREFARIAGDPTLDGPTTRRDLLAGPVAEVVALLGEAQQVQVQHPALADLHREVVTGLELEVRALTLLAEASSTNSPDALAEGLELHEQGRSVVDAWVRRVAELPPQP